MAHVKLSEDVRAVLEKCTFTADSVTLPGMLADRKLYLAVNKVLENAGGGWDKRRKAHVFPSGDPKVKLGLVLDTGVSIDQKKRWQAFYTPPDLARRLCARFRTSLMGKRCLEPSAGGGAIAEAMRDLGADVLCVEMNPEATPGLREKGFKVMEADFLSLTRADLGTFDAIAMNPPFTADQDCRHVLHAYEHFLKPGGELRAITGTGWTFDGKNKTRNAFRDFVEDNGYSTKIPEGTFDESGTAIATMLIQLSKPAATAPPANIITSTTSSPMPDIITAPPPHGSKSRPQRNGTAP